MQETGPTLAVLVRNPPKRAMKGSRGRYGTTKFTVDGQSALLELAVSGPFVDNETLIVQPTKGESLERRRGGSNLIDS